MPIEITDVKGPAARDQRHWQGSMDATEKRKFLRALKYSAAIALSVWLLFTLGCFWVCSIGVALLSSAYAFIFILFICFLPIIATFAHSLGE